MTQAVYVQVKQWIGAGGRDFKILTFAFPNKRAAKSFCKEANQRTWVEWAKEHYAKKEARE